MSKKTSKKTAKKAPLKKKAVKSNYSKPSAKKSGIVKKASAKKANTQSKLKAVKKAAPKKTTKLSSVKAVTKKAAPAKKAPLPVAKSSKVAVKKAEPGKSLKPIFQPAKKANSSQPFIHHVIPDPPGKFELEYTIHTSTPILFDFLTTPSGLSEWFCNDVDIRDGVYSFKWDDNEQQARLVNLVEESLVRYQWVDKKDHSYFEFRIERDDLTNDISLIVADFAENKEEQHSTTLLWNSQIEKLLHVLGSY